jgi:general stress protein YciG/hemerythrin superfamily protein
MPDAKKQRAGRKGGQVVSQDRAHMAAIGRKGGQRSHLKRAEKQEGTKGESQQHTDSPQKADLVSSNAPLHRSAPNIENHSENAIALLKSDHQLVNSLFEDYETAGGEDKAAIAQKILKELEIHTAIEEEIFYPAFKEKAGQEGEEEVAEALEEHQSVKTSIKELRTMDVDDETFESTFMDMMHDVQHHVSEEEGEMLPLAEETLSDSLEELGTEMMRRKHDFLESAAAETFS